MTKKKEIPKPKFRKGDKVLIEVIIDDDPIDEDNDWSEEDDRIYAVRTEVREVMGSIHEDDIISLAPIAEPLNYAAIVVVNNEAYQQLGIIEGESNWICQTKNPDKDFTWEELCLLGTPKVIWEPEL